MSQKEIAILGGGCFWCTEAVFDELRGVESVESGYIGGQVENPTYEQICTGHTGHAEAVKVTFDPAEVAYQDVLKIFFATHDPTTLNRQGNDVGTQYRSAIFYQDETQKNVAEETIQELNAQNIWNAPIVTEVVPNATFYEAEDYHQEYFIHNGNAPYCVYVVAPKVAKFRKEFMDRLKK